MKTWKDFPYWLKGGFIGIYTLCFLFIITLISRSVTFFYIPLYLDFIGRAYCSSTECPDFSGMIVMFTTPLSFFIIGSIIGWIYGRVKSKKV